MKGAQRLAIAMALVLGTGLCQAQPAEPAAPADPKATLQRLMEERRQREADDQKQVRARRDESWRRASKYLRDYLGRAGFGDRALQNAVIDFVEEQNLAREEVREAAAVCSRALEDQQMDDPEVQKLLDAYQAATARAQAKREAGLAQLDAQIHFSTNPRLKTFLTLRGLVGSEAQFMASALPDFGGFSELYELQRLFPARAEPNPAPLAAPAAQ